MDIMEEKKEGKKPSHTRRHRDRNRRKQIEVGIKRLHRDAVMPQYANPGDAGMDLTATSMSFDQMGNVVYRFGIALEIPEGYVGLIFPRSSIRKFALALTNCIGVIDSGYRGEVMVVYKPTLMFGRRILGHLWKLIRGREPDGLFEVGTRIAQLIIMPIPNVNFVEKLELSKTVRGDGGYGSSGC